VGSAASCNVCLGDDLAEAFLAGELVAPDDVAADHAGLLVAGSCSSPRSPAAPSLMSTSPSPKNEALYGQPAQLPADAIGPKMARLRREHHRHLGNGWCTRPPELDCAFESICETCTFFQTSIEFRPTLQAQRDDATAKHQDHREKLFGSLLARLDQDAS